MNVNIALLAGDGIGPEIIAQAVKALDRVARKYAHNFTYREALVGACAIDATGDPYPEETHKICREADAVLFGAIGDPKYDNDPKAPVRPEQGLLRMRKSLGLFANLRPIALFDTLADRSPLKAEVVRGTDFVCVRELTGGIYFGRPQGRDEGGDRAVDTCTYSRQEIERVLHVAFRLAMSRRRHLTVVDKANVLETSRFWREIAQQLASQYPEVELDFMFVDNAAMQIIRQPTHFGVRSRAFRADPRLLPAGRRQKHRQPDGCDPLGRHAARTSGADRRRERRPRRRKPGAHRRDRHRGPRRTGRTALFDLRGRGFHRRAYLAGNPARKRRVTHTKREFRTQPGNPAQRKGCNRRVATLFQFHSSRRFGAGSRLGSKPARP